MAFMEAGQVHDFPFLSNSQIVPFSYKFSWVLKVSPFFFLVVPVAYPQVCTSKMLYLRLGSSLCLHIHGTYRNICDELVLMDAHFSSELQFSSLSSNTFF